MEEKLGNIYLYESFSVPTLTSLAVDTESFYWRDSTALICFRIWAAGPMLNDQRLNN